MQTKQTLSTVLIAIVSGCLLTGCQPSQARQWETRQAPAPSQVLQETVPKGPSAVDSAIELSKRCAQLSEDIAALRQEKQTLIMENEQLKARVATLEPELAQSKRELEQANDLLIDMRLELNNWKTSVIGFREEMRQADAAQLQALIKIYELLGGEVATELTKDPNTSIGSRKEPVIRIQSNASDTDKPNA